MQRAWRWLVARWARWEAWQRVIRARLAFHAADAEVRLMQMGVVCGVYKAPAENWRGTKPWPLVERDVHERIEALEVRRDTLRRQLAAREVEWSRVS